MTPAMQRARGLDGLRGLAALSVFVVHVWLYGGSAYPARETALDKAVFELRLALVLFFVLSGYLLWRHFARATFEGGRRVDLWQYVKRRAARVVPAYWAAMAGAVLLLWGASSTRGVRLTPLDELPLYALFAQNYSDGTIMRLNPVTWTVCVELAFYALLPLIGLLAYRYARGRPRRQVMLLLGVFACGIGWNALAEALDWSMIGSKAMPAFLTYFALGMLLALWAESRRAAAGGDPTLNVRATAALVLAGTALVLFDGWWHATATAPGDDWLIQLFTDVPAAFGFLMLIAVAAFGTGPGAVWTRLRPLVALGVISYGFYLWHLPLMLGLRRFDLLPEGFVGTFVAGLTASVAFGAASWFWIEKPLMARAARRGRGLRPEAPDPRIADRDAEPLRRRGPSGRGVAREAGAAA